MKQLRMVSLCVMSLVLMAVSGQAADGAKAKSLYDRLEGKARRW